MRCNVVRRRYRQTTAIVVCAMLCARVADAQVRVQRTADARPGFTGVDPLAASRVLLDVRISDALHTGIVGRVTPGGVAMLPLARVLAFAGVMIRSDRGSVSASGDEGRPGFRVDAATRTVRVGGTTVRLTDVDLLLDGSTIFVSTALLSQLLLIGFDCDLPNAVIQLRNVAALPVVRRQTALEEAARSSGLSSAVSPVQMLASRTHTILQADYDLFVGRASVGRRTDGLQAADGGAISSAGFNARFSARAFGGAITGSVGTTALQSSLNDLRWTAIRASSHSLKRVVVGELDQRASLGTQNHGISIDNYPVDMSEQRLIRVHGRADPGWTYSVRQGASWLGGSRPEETLYEFLLPIVGDARRVDIVAWGPNGEERRIARSVRALPVRVQRGDFQYAMAAGRCENDDVGALAGPGGTRRCGFGASADGTFGVTDWFAARSGIDVARGTATPYVGAAMVVRQSLMLQASSGVGMRSRGVQAWSAQFDPLPSVALGYSHNRTVDGRRSTFSSLRVSPVRWAGRFGVDGFLSTTSGTTAPTRVGRVGASTGFRSSRLELYGLRTMTWPRTGPGAHIAATVDAVGVVAQASPAWMRLRHLQRSSLSGALDRTSRGDTRTSVQLATNITRASIEVARRFATSREPGQWSILLSPRSNRVRQHVSIARSDAGHGVGAASNTVMSFAGGASWSAESRSLTLSAEQSTGRGSIVGAAFLDLNENGLRDRNEPIVPDVPLTLGNRSLRTDSAGHFSAGRLTAAELVEITIDSMALPSPCWRAAASRWRVRAVDGGTASVMLPLHRGGVLEGRVLRSQRRAGTFQTVLSPWIDPPNLTAISRATERAYPLEVFGSGSFYLLGIPFGVYDIIMAEADQRRNNIVMAPARVTVSATTLMSEESARANDACPSTVAILRTRPRDAGEIRRVAARGDLALPDGAAPADASTVTMTTGVARSDAPQRDSTNTNYERVPHATSVHRSDDLATDESLDHRDRSARPSTRREVRNSTRALRAFDARRRRRRDTLSRRVARERSSVLSRAGPGGGSGIACNPDDPRRLLLTAVHFTVRECPTDRWRRPSPVPHAVDMRRNPPPWRREPD